MTDRIRAACADGLRALADALERDPRLPVPRYVTASIFPRGVSDADEQAKVAALAEILGVEVEITMRGHHVATRWWGPVRYEVCAIPRTETEGPSAPGAPSARQLGAGDEGDPGLTGGSGPGSPAPDLSDPQPVSPHVAGPESGGQASPPRVGPAARGGEPGEAAP